MEGIGFIDFLTDKESNIEFLNEGYCYNELIYNSIGMPIDFIICKANKSFINIVQKKENDLLYNKASGVLGEECRKKIINSLFEYKIDISIKLINIVNIDNKYYKVLIFINDEKHFHLLFIDITSKIESNRIIKKYEMLYRNSVEIFMFIDSDFNIIETNQSGINTYGYSERQLLNMKKYDLRRDKSKIAIEKDIQSALKNNSLYETTHIKKDGTCFPVEVRIQKMGDMDNIYVVMIRDITDRKKYEDELFYLANHDYLTGLHNRCYTLNQMNVEMEKLKVYSFKFAIIYLDVDKFKSFNDKYGHDIGDLVLRRLSYLLLKNTKREDIVGRIGGDEFILYIPNIKRSKDVELIVNNIITDLEKPINIGALKINIKVSIGIAIYPDSSDRLQNLLVYADQAMYQAKKISGNSFTIYDKIYLEQEV